MSEEVSLIVVRSFRSLAIRLLGIDIDKELEPLISARIAKRLKHLQLPVHGYLARLYEEKNGDEMVALLDFIRPRSAPFFARWRDCEELHAVIRQRLSDGIRRLRFWSAGSGSGEEPYTMVMIALDAMEDAQVGPDEVDLKIFATDISARIIEQGKCGLFAKPQVRYVPSSLLHRHFRTTCFGVEISEEIKSRVVFQRLNLACTPYPMTAPWDVIFCQEGLTPLVPDARMRATKTVQSLLADRGLLCTGSGEDLANTTVRPGKTMPPSLC